MSIPQSPQPENFDEKEVYAFYGRCAFYAQVLEQGLTNLTTILHTRGLTRVTREALEKAFDRLEFFTCGRLIADVRKKIDVSPAIEANLKEALKNRNYLTHRFFSSHDINFACHSGRKIMIEELREMTTRFQQVDDAVEAINLPLWEKIGITQERIEAEIQKMNSEARSRDI